MTATTASKSITDHLADHFAWFGTISNTDSATQSINFSAPSTGVFFSKKRECVFSADYWKLNDDGTLEWDGQANLVDEEGNILISWEAMGLENNEDIDGGLLRLMGLEDNEINRSQIGSLVWDIAMNPDYLAPEDLLFLLGTERHYDALVARRDPSVVNVQEGNFSGPMSVLRDLINLDGFDSVWIDEMGYDAWMESRTEGTFPQLNLEYPDSLTPWSSEEVGELQKYLCTMIAGHRNTDLLASIADMPESEIYELIKQIENKEHFSQTDFYRIANASKFDGIPSELAGNDYGTLLSLMGLADGVQQVTTEDINSGELELGALMTIWRNDQYANIAQGLWPPLPRWGHTGQNGGLTVENFGTNQERITISWIDQFGNAVKTDKFYTTDSEDHWADADRRNFKWYKNWDDLTLLTTNIFNDITQRQIELGLLRLQTVLSRM
jgi:hypothetical protein